MDFLLWRGNYSSLFDAQRLRFVLKSGPIFSSTVSREMGPSGGDVWLSLPLSLGGVVVAVGGFMQRAEFRLSVERTVVSLWLSREQAVRGRG